MLYTVSDSLNIKVMAFLTEDDVTLCLCAMIRPPLFFVLSMHVKPGIHYATFTILADYKTLGVLTK